MRVKGIDQYNSNYLDIPLAKLDSKLEDVTSLSAGKEVVVVCKRGNNSQRAVLYLKENSISAKDIVGGLAQWAKMDSSFPIY